MAAVAAAAVALLLYVAGVSGNLALAIAIASVTIVVCGLSALAGVALGHQTPKASRWLLWMWTPGVIIVSGAVGAFVLYAGVQWAAGEDASEQVKAIGGALAALITLVAATIGDSLKGHLTPWLASKALWSRYSEEFPCLPPSDGPGRVAYELLGDLHQGGADAWDGPNIEGLLVAIAAAHEAGEYHGGANQPC